MALDPTVGGTSANSYATLAEANAYFLERSAVAGWENADDQTALLIMATRVLEALFSPFRKLIRPAPPAYPYYVTYSTWTGTPASTTQTLLWPRSGMFNRLGVAIPTNVNPKELKHAQIELAGQLGTADRTLDSDIALQGITAVKAGSVSVNFREGLDVTKTIPDFVFQLLVPSWLTDEIIEPARRATFEIV